MEKTGYPIFDPSYKQDHQLRIIGLYKAETTEALVTSYGPMPLQTILEEAVHHPILIKRFPHIVMPMIDFKLNGDANMLRKAYKMTTAFMEALIVLELMVLAIGHEKERPTIFPRKDSANRKTRVDLIDLNDYYIVFGRKFYEDWWKAKERTMRLLVKSGKADPLTDPFPLLCWAADSVSRLTGEKVFEQKNGADMAFYLLESLFKTNPMGVSFHLLEGRKRELKNAISPSDIESLHSMVVAFFKKRQAIVVNPIGTRMYLFAKTFICSPNTICEPRTFLAKLNLLSQYPIVRITKHGTESATLNAVQALALSSLKPYMPTLPGDPKCDALNEFVQKSEEINDNLKPDDTLFGNDLLSRQSKEKEFLLDTMKIIIDYHVNIGRGCCEQHSEAMQMVPYLKKALQNNRYVKRLHEKAEKMASLVVYSRNTTVQQ